MSLDALENQIRKIIASNEGALALRGIDESAVKQILGNIAAELDLEGPEIVAEDRSLTIVGTINLPFISDIQVTLRFESVDGTSVETCSLHLKTISEADVSLAKEFGFAPLEDVINKFLPPSSQEVDLLIAYSLKTKEYTIESEAGFTVPSLNFSISDVKIKIEQKLNDYDQMAFSLDIQGIVSIGDYAITLECKFPSDSGLFEIKGSLPLSTDLLTIVENCLRTVNISVPPGLSQLGTSEITNLSVRIVPEISLLSVMITTNFGNAEFVIMEQPDSVDLMMILALPIDLNSALKMLGVVETPEHIATALSESVLVLASEFLDKEFCLDVQPLQTVELTEDVNSGINFQASFKDGMITEVLPIDSLKIHGTIGLSPISLELQVSSTLEFTLTEFLLFKGFLFRISLDVSEYKVELGADMDLRMGEECLPLRGSISLVGPPPSLMLSTYMTEEWTEPFGVKGVTLKKLGVNLGFEPPVPAFGFMADAIIGSFTGSAAIQLAGSVLQLLSIEFNELNIGTLVRYLASSFNLDIAESFITFLDGIALEDVNFHMALTDVEIGGVEYKAGFHMRATVHIFDTTIFAAAMVDAESGLYFYAEMDPINISPDGFEIIKLTNASDSNKGAMMELDLRTTSNSRQIVVSGAISIFNELLKGLVDIDIDETGFSILANCKIIDLFEASLDVTGPNLDSLLNGSGEGIFLKAHMKNDLFTVVRKSILDYIRGVTDSAVTELTNAENALAAARREVDDWDDQIKELTGQLESTRAAAVTELEDAIKIVNDAQNELDKIDGQISNHESKIRALNKEIAYWNNWYASLGPLAKIWYSLKYASEVGGRESEKAKHYAAIGLLQLSKIAAWALLELAETSLKIAEALVVASDPSVDPDLKALILSHAAAWAILEAAEGLVFSIRVATSAFSSLVQYIVDWSLDKAFDIKTATFEANFNDVKGRTVELEADIVFIGVASHIEFSLDFDDHIASIKNLASDLLTNLGIELPP
jgi:hypothetical protein